MTKNKKLIILIVGCVIVALALGLGLGLGLKNHGPAPPYHPMPLAPGSPLGAAPGTCMPPSGFPRSNSQCCKNVIYNIGGLPAQNNKNTLNCYETCIHDYNCDCSKFDYKNRAFPADDPCSSSYKYSPSHPGVIAGAQCFGSCLAKTQINRVL